jgi:hypothetical protein
MGCKSATHNCVYTQQSYRGLYKWLFFFFFFTFFFFFLRFFTTVALIKGTIIYGIFIG